MSAHTAMQIRRSAARYKRRRAKAKAKGCTCVLSLHFNPNFELPHNDYLIRHSRYMIADCPFHKGKN